MVITEESVRSSQTRIALEGPVCAHSPNDGRRWGVFPSLTGLTSDADKVGDKVAVDEMGSVSDEASDTILHVESYEEPQTVRPRMALPDVATHLPVLLE